MDLISPKDFIQVIGDWGHDVYVFLDISPISEGNNLCISVFGPRIDKFDIDP